MDVKAKAAGVTFGEGDVVVIAGPCVIESAELVTEVASRVKEICDALDMQYVFKASFDKANRTSVESFRGPGSEKGLAILDGVRASLDVPVLTDIHETWQAEDIAEVVDIIQIPAFLCRQTDLILSAARTGKCVNIKKGQFVAPWDMKNSVQKAKSTGNENIMVCERGTSFGYNQLVVDMCSLPVMRGLGCPVVFDATHSVQRPGGLGNASGGAREFIPTLARAASAVGIDAIFLEVHPDPDKALCDAASMLALADLPQLLADVKNINTLSRKDGEIGA